MSSIEHFTNQRKDFHWKQCVGVEADKPKSARSSAQFPMTAACAIVTSGRLKDPDRFMKCSIELTIDRNMEDFSREISCELQKTHLAFLHALDLFHPRMLLRGFMHQMIDNILVIKNKELTCFFDPESLIVFVKEDKGIKDEKIISEYNENKQSFPKLESSKKTYSYQDFSLVDLELHVTNNCNLRCKYCYLSDGCNQEKNLEMSEQVIERSYRFVLDAFPKVTNVHISLFGGEPLLFWKKFPVLVKMAKEIFKNQKVTIGFPTNGTIVSEEILAFLKANHIGFQLSLDGTEKEQDHLRPMANGRGTFEIINRNLSKFKEIHSSPGVRTTITPYNMNLSKLYLFFKEKGFKKISFATCSSCQNDLEIKEKDLPQLFHEWELVADLYLEDLSKGSSLQIHPIFSLLMALHFGDKKAHFCRSGKNLFAVSIAGDIYSCHRFVGNENYKIGNLERGFFEESPIKQALLSRNLEEEKECKHCFARHLCGGGCFHERSQPSFENFCKIYTHLLVQAIRIYAELQVNHPEAFEKIIQRLHKHKKLESSGSNL